MYNTLKRYRYLNDPLLLYNSAVERVNIRDFKGALADLDYAIELNPKYAEAYYLRGLIWGKELKKYKKAIKNFNKAISINSNFAEAYYDRGVTYRILDYLNKACEDWHQAFKLGYKTALSMLNKYCM
ncbi:MAG: tetratricopeptide repeat protein [Ignavibacteria bacterium]